MKEKTFLMIKPDGIQRRLIGTIFARLEKKGLKLQGLKMLQLDDQKAKTLYSVHEGKSFYTKLVQFIQTAPIIVTVWEGNNAVYIVRKIIGDTDPLKSAPGTLRGDYSINITYNVVHASDSLENAIRETSLFFTPDEIIDYPMTNGRWLNEEG